MTNYQNFGSAAYKLLTQAKNATFELMDAVLTTRNAASLADLSLSPMFRRKWSSVYEALQDTRPNRDKLMRLYIEHLPPKEDLVFAIDHTAWSRPYSKTLKERTYEHQPSTSGKIAVGQGYSTIAWIPETNGSWAIPLRHERITSWEAPIGKAAWQLSQVCKHLNNRPLVLLDSEYGNASWVNATNELEANSLIRVRSNICLYSAPSVYGGKGRPRQHGDKFKLNDSSTWWEPNQNLEVDDAQWGMIRIKRWDELHFRRSSTQNMNLILVERVESTASGKKLKPLWLVWIGQTMPKVETLWKQYLRRFCVDHWYRFLKQRLHWTLPQLGTPQQCERWSDLMPLITWQLWLARELVSDRHLPWQKPQVHLTPGRVAQSMLTLLWEIGTPCVIPKPRGKSPGWLPGTHRRKRIRYPVVKKGQFRAKKTKK